jgi:septum site-determining protein MinC
MSDVSRSGAPPTKPSTFEIKSANLPLVALLLKTTHLPTLTAEWLAQFGDSPDFFDQDPLVIDLSPLAHQPDAEGVPDFDALLALLRGHRVCPIAVKGGTPAQVAAAQAAGLVVATDVVLPRTSTPEPVVEPVADTGHETPAAPVPTPPPAAGLPALVVDKPLRSGQQVYARGRDLVVMAMVNPGAEVIADGHIHVYAPLRGKAIAGARGNGDARIFALSMEAELISIAGIYRTSDVPLPADVQGRPAMVSLQVGPEGDKLVLSPLQT